ncbi:hypothetical protein [Photobacterium sanguinicancri]|uniref:hypothetical protein n=1 Tax=Photobacterium sanguinicancri TaxID=875932 RepID=UPI000789386F|nr:hypothetical protein [Photobacterium sanguinicancri]KXI21646.1 hypothetical protein AS132_19245 [Photobacterium sanguinicancri]
MNSQIIEIINRNKHFVYLSAIGINTNGLKKEILESVDENEIDIFSNRSHQMLSPNVYLESLIFKCICKYLHEEYKESMIFENKSRLDIKTIIATSKSLIERPRIMKPSDVVKGFKDPDYKNGFVTISRFDKELDIEEYGKKTTKKGTMVFEGVLPHKIEVNPLLDWPQTNDIWDNTYCYGKPFIQGFCVNTGSIETQFVLWMNSELLTMLGLKLDNYNNGLRALNSNNEIVLQFRCWREQLIGNGASFVGMDSNIAKLEGCDLILREDYFNKLKSIVPDLTYYSEVT